MKLEKHWINWGRSSSRLRLPKVLLEIGSIMKYPYPVVRWGKRCWKDSNLGQKKKTRSWWRTTSCAPGATETWSNFSMFWRMANVDTGTQIIHFALISSILNCRRQAGVLWRRPPWRAHNRYFYHLLLYRTASHSFGFAEFLSCQIPARISCANASNFQSFGERGRERERVRERERWYVGFCFASYWWLCRSAGAKKIRRAWPDICQRRSSVFRWRHPCNTEAANFSHSKCVGELPLAECQVKIKVLRLGTWEFSVTLRAKR